MALLHLLRSCFTLDLAVAHLNHGLRGEESDLDQRLVVETARGLGIPCHTREVQVRSAAAQGESPEEAARRIRHLFFREVCQEHGYRVVATGHTLDDHIETMLFRLIRGTGPGGLGGIKPRSGQVIHPLLEATRAQLLDYLRQLGAAYRVDSSNFNLEVPRNRIRHQVIPLLQALNPGFGDHLVSLSRILQQEDALVQEQADDALRACTVDSRPDRVIISLPCFNGMSEPIRRRVVIKAAEGMGRAGILTCGALDRILRGTGTDRSGKSARTGGSGPPWGGPGGSTVLFSSAAFTVRTEYRSLVVEKTVVDAGGGEYLYLVREVPSSLYIRELGQTLRCRVTGPVAGFSGSRVCLDFDKITLPLAVRNRREGDRIRLSFQKHGRSDDQGGPAGRKRPVSGTKKLKDLLIDHKVPRAIRDRVPVVATQGTLAAVFCSVYGRDNRVSDHCLVTQESTRVLVMELVPDIGDHRPAD
jgi:tRNA(Ile)-lysidine synthase